MKFKSPTDEPVHLALNTGHTAIIYPEFTEIEPRFHRAAVAEGCIPFGQEAIAENDAPDFNRKQVIIDALNAMLDGGAENDFTGAGKPSPTKVSERVGFTVSRSECNAVWDELSNESK